MRKEIFKNGIILHSEIIDFIFLLSVILSIISMHTILDNIGMLIFVISILLMRNKRIIQCFNLYFILEIVFILYGYIQIQKNIVVNEQVAREKITTLIICLIYYIVVYMYMLGFKNKRKIMELLVRGIFIGLVILLICNINSVLTGRFGGQGIRIFNIGIGRLNSTYIGHLSGIALFLSLLLYWETDKGKATRYSIFFIGNILLSGTRKMLIMVAISYIIIPYLYNKNGNFLKFISNILKGIVICLVVYMGVTKIPILYNAIGVRIEAIVEVLVVGSTNESSFNTRAELIKKATKAFEQKPILGWGLDNFRHVINKGGYYSHNNFLEILVSGGIVGFIIYYLKYIYVMILTFTSKKVKTDEEYFTIKMLRFLLIVLIVLEYWQVTYYYRLFVLPYIITLAYSNKNYKISFKKEIKKSI